MDQQLLASASPEKLELMLQVLRESRLLTEAEARKNEEIRRSKEVDLAIEQLRKDNERAAAGPSSTPSISGSPALHIQQPTMKLPPTVEYTSGLQQPTTTTSILDLSSSPANQPEVFSVQTSVSMNPAVTAFDDSVENDPISEYSWLKELLGITNLSNLPYVTTPLKTNPINNNNHLINSNSNSIGRPSNHSIHSNPINHNAINNAINQHIQGINSHPINPMNGMSQYNQGRPPFQNPGSQFDFTTYPINADFCASTPSNTHPSASPDLSIPKSTPSLTFQTTITTPTPTPTPTTSNYSYTQSPSTLTTPIASQIQYASTEGSSNASERQPSPPLPFADADKRTITTVPVNLGEEDDLPSINLAKNSIRKRGHCMDCKSNLCLFIFHGTSDAEIEASGGVITNATCIPCFVAKNGPAALTNVKDKDDLEFLGIKSKRKRKARRVTRDTHLRCEACMKQFGFGGIRMGPVGNGSGSGSGSDAADHEWIEPKFGVEAICDSCVNQFDFCTQCGGGGAFRTGKWRPRQLFDFGRRTCSLPHKRYGEFSNIQITTFRCPFERIEDEHGNVILPFEPEPFIEKPDSAVMARMIQSLPEGRITSNLEWLRTKRKDIMAVYRMTGFTQCATANYMGVHTHLENWNKLVGRLDTGGKELDRITLGGAITIDKTSPKYPAFPDDIARIVAVGDVLRPVSTGKKDKDLSDDEKYELHMAGFQFMSWNRPGRYVGLLHGMTVLGLSKDQMYEPGNFYCDLHMSCLRRIQRDSQRLGIPPPIHLFSFLYNSDLESGSWLAHNCQRFGFQVLPDYCRKWGFKEEDLVHMDTFIFVKEHIETMTMIVMRWEDIPWHLWTSGNERQ
ncbi:hypothetical protein HDU97_009131 [Phlyctochytrium planicorne]|nr:hypothetical protein HDU97_009131 [Phlyctochytrium planicorne]